MTQIKTLKSVLLIAFTIVSLNVVSCSSDDNDQTVSVSVNGTVLFDDGDDFLGDVNGDFTGTGGSVSRTFLWQNNQNTADYNADITATTEGQFNIVVIDADNNEVLNRSLSGATEPDTIDGVTSNGTPGLWSVIITLDSFTGDGSFSLSAGN